MRAENAICLAIVSLALIGLRTSAIEEDNSQGTKSSCSTICPAIYDPVCGSDGNTYPNSCKLAVHNCVNNDNVSQAYKGTCEGEGQRKGTNPCAFTTCREGSDCVVKSGQAECVCRTNCPFNYEPLCGSDGKDYSNECQLKVYNCENNKNVIAAYPGTCENPQTDPCATVRCRSGASCEVVKGRAKCVCNSICPEYIDELCGSDGNTYSNECRLDVYNCENNKNVAKAYSGPCRGNQCRYTKCRAGATCVLQNGRAKCICNRRCPNYFAPADVCGSDGRTYSSPCELENHNCRTQKNVVQVHDGPCDQTNS